ncbi:MAG TPA: DUF427 domain-containing protein [Solirubrobacterales bacterium]|nr:DUF427 domain-containing protein [Solirubrobacterales bacterium]
MRGGRRGLRRPPAEPLRAGRRDPLHFTALERTDTTTYCPYKGATSDYWSARIGDTVHRDIAWSYAYPSPQVLQIAGRVAFYDERVDTFLDEVPVERPRTKFSENDS